MSESSPTIIVTDNETIPCNAIESVVLAGVALDANFVATELKLERGVPSPNDPWIVEQSIRAVPPTKPPSTLPPPGNMSLHLRLGRKLGGGSVGSVYIATVQTPESSPELSETSLPPLVVKVSRRRRSWELLREAYYYEEMESLQGVAVPRCYGVFHCRIPGDWTFVPWGLGPICEGYDDEESDSEDESEDEGGVGSGGGSGGVPSYAISLLVLEQLGDHLPLGKLLPDGTRQDIYDMYADLAELGIAHVDIRYYNILHAPPSPPGFPGISSPNQKRTYQWRLVDFANACKTNMSTLAAYFHNHSALLPLLEGVASGRIVEPWPDD